MEHAAFDRSPHILPSFPERIPQLAGGMATQIVLNRKRRAKEERSRAPNGSQFDNPMYYAESDITSEDNGAGEQLGMEEAIKDIEE